VSNSNVIQTPWKNAAKTGKKRDADLIKKRGQKSKKRDFFPAVFTLQVLFLQKYFIFLCSNYLSDLFFNKVNTASNFIAH
jgi:hypothetical protein